MSDLDLSKPVKTMDGRAVEILSTEGREPYPVVGYLGDDNSDVQCWTTAGEFECGALCGLNLENIPQKRSGWVNIYPHSRDRQTGNMIHESKKAAKAVSLQGAIQAYIEWEE